MTPEGSQEGKHCTATCFL